MCCETLEKHYVSPVSIMHHENIMIVVPHPEFNTDISLFQFVLIWKSCLLDCLWIINSLRSRAINLPASNSLSQTKINNWFATLYYYDIIIDANNCLFDKLMFSYSPWAMILHSPFIGWPSRRFNGQHFNFW